MIYLYVNLKQGRKHKAHEPQLEILRATFHDQRKKLSIVDPHQLLIRELNKFHTEACPRLILHF